MAPAAVIFYKAGVEFSGALSDRVQHMPILSFLTAALSHQLNVEAAVPDAGKGENKNAAKPHAAA
jgi:hypothetical protein